MIKIFKKNRTFRLRATRAYLLTILVCTLLLFCFSIVSIYEQSRTVQTLSTYNIQLSAKQMASDLENQLESLATKCLSSENMGRLAYIRGKEGTPEKLRAYRVYFRALKNEHPVAESFFIFDRDELIFPRISPPSPQSLSIAASAGQGADAARFSRLLSQGESRDLNQPARAAEYYKRAEELAVSDRLKALALFRRAQALEKANQATGAVEAYQNLLSQYGNEYNESGVPYILSLYAAPEELTQKLLPSIPQSSRELYQNLINGTWEISAEQAEKYMARLEQSLGLSASSRQKTGFLHSFDMARAVENNPKPSRNVDPFEVMQQECTYNGKAYQTYRVFVSSDEGNSITVGFSASLQWIRDQLLPAFLQKPEYSELAAISLLETSDYENNSTSDRGITVAFPSLTFANLHIPYETEDLRAAARKEVWYVGLAAAMLLCVMGVGLKLLIGVSWDIRWFQLRSDFVSGVSHEFKTPLSLIRLYSETLATANQDYSEEDRSNYIRIIARESERMSRLVDNVLSFAKIEQGRFRYEMQEGDIRETVTQTVNDYSEYLTWRGFSVRCSIWPQLPKVRFNPEQVSEMILNLMDNARKYSGKSRQIRVNVWVQNQEVIIEVRDHGIGIPSGEREKIFQPFHRLAKGNEHGGCGLGLYLVDQVMKEHGGRVEVESEANSGSRFRLVFPSSSHKKVKAWRKNTHELTEAHFERQVQN